MPNTVSGAYDDNVIALLREARVSVTRVTPREVEALLDQLDGWRENASILRAAR